MSVVACAPTRPAECSDPNVLDLVRNLIVQHAGGRSVMASLNAAELREAIVIEMPRAVGYDEGIKKLSCQARLYAPYVGRTDGLGYTVPIEYDSQILDNGDDGVYIAIQEGDVIGIDAAVRTWRDARDAAQSAPVEAAAPSQGERESGGETSADEDYGNARPDDYEEGMEGRFDPPETHASTEASISPSFNCAKASTNAERLICSDADLAGLDAEMADVFKQARASASDSKALVADQNAWRREVRDACSDVACMSSAYADRILYLYRPH